MVQLRKLVRFRCVGDFSAIATLVLGILLHCASSVTCDMTSAEELSRDRYLPEDINTRYIYEGCSETSLVMTVCNPDKYSDTMVTFCPVTGEVKFYDFKIGTIIRQVNSSDLIGPYDSSMASAFEFSPNCEFMLAAREKVGLISFNTQTRWLNLADNNGIIDHKISTRSDRVYILEGQHPNMTLKCTDLSTQLSTRESFRFCEGDCSLRYHFYRIVINSQNTRLYVIPSGDTRTKVIIFDISAPSCVTRFIEIKRYFEVANFAFPSKDLNRIMVDSGHVLQSNDVSSRDLEGRGYINASTTPYKWLVQSPERPHYVYGFKRGDNKHIHVYSWPYLNGLQSKLIREVPDTHLTSTELISMEIVRLRTNEGYILVVLSRCRTPDGLYWVRITLEALPVPSISTLYDTHVTASSWKHPNDQNTVVLTTSSDQRGEILYDQNTVCTLSDGFFIGLRHAELHLINLTSYQISVFHLPLPGLKVTVDDRCSLLAVVHNGYVTIVHLAGSPLRVVKNNTFPVPSYDAWRALIRGRHVFLFPKHGNASNQFLVNFWRVDTESGAVSAQGGRLTGAPACYMHPNKRWLYCPTIQQTPRYIYKFNISDDGDLTYLEKKIAISVCQPIWYGSSGEQMYCSSGAVLATNISTSADLQVLFPLDEYSGFNSFAETKNNSLLALKNEMTAILVYSLIDGQLEGAIQLPLTPECTFAPPYFTFEDVYHNRDSDLLVVVVTRKEQLYSLQYNGIGRTLVVVARLGEGSILQEPVSVIRRRQKYFPHKLCGIGVSQSFYIPDDNSKPDGGPAAVVIVACCATFIFLALALVTLCICRYKYKRRQGSNSTRDGRADAQIHRNYAFGNDFDNVYDPPPYSEVTLTPDGSTGDTINQTGRGTNGQLSGLPTYEEAIKSSNTIDSQLESTNETAV